jgi:4-amino-4-deoxy-L-arabinose transferase-like glycosyltransferase
MALTVAGTIVAALIVAYLPGALCFRLPVADRDRRGSLLAEERVFWQVFISLAWSVGVTFALAAVSAYSFPRLLLINTAVSLTMLVASRGRLRWQGHAGGPTFGTLLPVLLIGVAIVRFFPVSEYIVGGKDPGVYINEGIAIDRTGALFRNDPVVAAVPAAARDLFFRNHGNAEYYGVRFMGVFVNDPATGEVIPGFPHLYPASIAIGEGLAGTRGALSMVGVWATLGLLAVYFVGARLLGRLPAFAAAAVLALNLVEVWYGRYPNTEVAMQALLFAGLLAVARAHQDDDPFFGWVAGGLGALLLFLRFDAFLALAGVGGAMIVTWLARGTPLRWGAVIPIAVGAPLAFAYYAGPMQQYFFIYRVNLPAPMTAVGLAAVAALALMVLSRARRTIEGSLTRHLPLLIAGPATLLAIYALAFRHPEGLLTTHDAYSLRTFRDAYVLWPALAAAVIGYAGSARRLFWRDPALFLVFAAFSIFFFYKIRIVPEQFWMARRFLPVILPGTMLFAAAAAFGISTPERRRSAGRALAGMAFMALVGWQYVTAAAPVAAHREYKGAVQQVAQLAALFTPRDLVIVEGRDAQSDFHIFALPLSDIHGLNVLVLESPRPDRRVLEAFLDDARGKYARVFFLGGGGTDLLSRRIIATPIAFTPLTVPEYETVQCCSEEKAAERYWDRIPTGARRKDLGYSVFELHLDGAARRGFSLDVGYLDDLNVVRFHAREVTEGESFRWSQRQSFVAVTGLTGGEREVVLTMSAGGRPPGAEPATVEVFFNDAPIGRVTVTEGFREYRLALPADAARLAAQSDDPAQLRLLTNPWSPSDFGGGADTRPLGVMISKVELH